MLTNSVHISFKLMGDFLLFLMIFHINESYMANILSFAEFTTIAGVHINMETYKEKLINVQI